MFTLGKRFVLLIVAATTLILSLPTLLGHNTSVHFPRFSNLQRFQLGAGAGSPEQLQRAIDATIAEALDQRIGQVLITKLECPPPQYNRYLPLKGKRVFIALNLHDSEAVLPTLLHALMETIRFVGPENVFLSIYESGSNDKSSPIIDSAVAYFQDLGLGGLQASTNALTIDFDDMNRIAALADYRNMAIEPLLSMEKPSENILFVNDVYACAFQLLELLYQHHAHSADMTSGFDWEDNGIFRDTWVARDIKGDLITDIPDNGFAYSDDMFHNSPIDKARFNHGESFQVYSTWNGAIVMNTKPFLEHGVQFRRGRRDECAASEAQLIAKDFWSRNFTRVMVVPTVNLAYELEAAKTQLAKPVSQSLFNGTVTFKTTPPAKVKCRPWPELTGLDQQPWTDMYWDNAVDDLQELEKMGDPYKDLGPDGNFHEHPAKHEKVQEEEESTSSKLPKRSMRRVRASS